MSKNTDRKLVAYFRVSTCQQGESGLGLEAQQASVRGYAERTGCRIVASYQEVESGRKADRPELAKALEHAKLARATLVIARLDRLARNLHFLSGLMESGVEFVACDVPGASRLTLHILAAVAEAETEMISERTKAALAAYKARGGLLGGAHPNYRRPEPEQRQEAARRAGKVLRSRADSYYRALAPRVNELRLSGMTQQAIADRFNGEGLTTQSGGPWTQVAVLRVLRRFAT
jgi:DNA invertase Pin-like site-specific DNA recombinase